MANYISYAIRKCDVFGDSYVEYKNVQSADQARQISKAGGGFGYDWQSNDKMTSVYPGFENMKKACEEIAKINRAA